jgi:hypothetical protein
MPDSSPSARRSAPDPDPSPGHDDASAPDPGPAVDQAARELAALAARSDPVPAEVVETARRALKRERAKPHPPRDEDES